jgi:hypothetical protein
MQMTRAGSSARRGAARASKTGFGKYAALPSTLSGSYTLQLSDDTYLYTGMIDLE